MLALLELAGQAGAAVSLANGGLAAAVGIPFFAPAMLGAFAGQALLRPRRGELAATAALAAALLLPLSHLVSGSAAGLFAVACTALGTASIAVLAVVALRSRGGSDRSADDALLPAAILPLFALVAHPMVYLTVALWPTTWDHRLYLADLAFGAPLSFVVGRAVAAVPLLPELCLAVYVALPLALMVVHALRRRHGVRSADALVAFVALTAVGWLAYQLVPVAGPVWAFGAAFPLAPPDPAALAPAKAMVVPAPRNCMPSLHSAWALLVWWCARPLPRWPRMAASAFLAITLLATVGLGFHYAVDLVAAFPLTTAVHAWATSTRDPQLRRTAIGAGALLTLGWIALTTAGAGLLGLSPLLAWLSAGAVVAVSCVLGRRVDAARVEDAAAPQLVLPLSPTGRAGVAVFAAAAVAVFVHWAVYANALGPLLGSGASVRAVMAAAVLTAAAAGLGAGASLGRVPAPLGTALTAIALALCSAASPQAFEWSASWAAVRFPFPFDLVAAGPLLLPEGLLLGLLAAFVARPAGSMAALLQGAMPVVALAAVAMAYAVMPSLYSRHLPTALHAMAAVAAVALALAARAAKEQAPQAGGASRRELAALLVAGAVAGVAVGATNLLRTVAAGDLAQGRAHGVVAVTLGLALGATVARRVRRVSPLAGLGCSAAGLVAVVVLTLPLWPTLPDYFASFRDYAEHHATVTTFAEREVVRLALALLTLLPASVCAGAGLALVVDARAAQPDSRAAGVWLAGVGAGLVAGLFAGMPAARSVDVAALVSGNGLVFAPVPRAPVVAAVMTADGLAAAHRDAAGDVQWTVNGRLRGGGAAAADLVAAARPVPGRLRALLVGMGSGAAVRGLLAAGFAEIVVLEPDAGVVRLAATILGAAGAEVLADPRVTVAHDDGRRGLDLGEGAADFLAIDLPEASAPGAALLLTREGYASAKRRLASGGCLAQRLDLAELSPLALGSVLAGARTSFANVALRFRGNDAMLLACDVALAEPDWPRLPAPESSPWLGPPLVERLLGAMAEQLGVSPSALAASDRDLFLAYQAPKTLTQHADPSQQSLPLLRRFVAASIP